MPDVMRCPFCAKDTVVPYRVINGVQWYRCTSCGSKFKTPIIVPEKAVASGEPALEPGE
jgi:ribosomal protein L37AE/L43A